MVYLSLDKRHTRFNTKYSKDPILTYLCTLILENGPDTKIETHVPVVVIGDLDVVKSGEADVILLANSLMVSCLPTEIPDKIEVSISELPESPK